MEGSYGPLFEIDVNLGYRINDELALSRDNSRNRELSIKAAINYINPNFSHQDVLRCKGYQATPAPQKQTKRLCICTIFHPNAILFCSRSFNPTASTSTPSSAASASRGSVRLSPAPSSMISPCILRGLFFIFFVFIWCSPSSTW